mmetsp:Transcript_59944/g.70041  ORF Transcript_59944/g.70041 Transcript_59944/m.70041 type:complete len:150 (-) Transcript_59944:566-1015(-)
MSLRRRPKQNTSPLATTTANRRRVKKRGSILTELRLLLSFVFILSFLYRKRHHLKRIRGEAPTNSHPNLNTNAVTEETVVLPTYMSDEKLESKPTSIRKPHQTEIQEPQGKRKPSTKKKRRGFKFLQRFGDSVRQKFDTKVKRRTTDEL